MRGLLVHVGALNLTASHCTCRESRIDEYGYASRLTNVEHTLNMAILSVALYRACEDSCAYRKRRRHCVD
jgi:hypothetical protein